ncbi:fibronectin type III domain-containing protein [Actinoplanes sp. NPDC026670]|uniref:fibronectin type III domain-containing protein n=1 Tax=Actinoplanes sp. NPDC026670 TaxID=3154700 RepID=UPI0033F5C49B
MAITWGSYNGNLRFGIDLYTSTPSTSSTSVTVTAKLYIQCSDGWRFDDTQTYSWQGGSASFSNTLSDGASKLLDTVTSTRAIDYDGTGSVTYSASLSGAYNGAKPTHSRTITLPKRPPSVPSAPPAPDVSSITATSAYFTWGTPATNGSSLTGNAGQVSTSSSFISIATSWSESGWNGQSVTGLAKGTVYYVRVRAQNGVGWSGWSGARQFETASTTASAPGLNAIYDIEAQAAWWSWSAPSDAGGEAITGYEIQRATDSGFTQNVVSFIDAATPAKISGLVPGTTYYTRIRARSAAGSGAWSNVRSFRTLSALWIGNGSAWKPALVYVGNGTSWVLATVKVGDGTNWK